jgi:serine/threonine protein kinase
MAFTLLGNRYQVLQTLGSGGFGTTYLAEDLQMPSRRKCVIKQLKPIANNPQIYQLVQERFQREAATLETLGDGSRQIPKLYAYFAESEHFYLIQEWIEGMTLHEKVKAQGAIPEAEVKQILAQILPTLTYIHGQHIVHRDIKPDNIILRQRDNHPVLIDFGAVRETMGTVVNSQGSAASSIVIGTPGFMPSEQAAGRPLYSSDLYSLGLTMIYLLTTKFPQELELDPASGEVVWRKHAAHVSAEFADVLEKVIQYHPRDRYHTAEMLLTALQPQLNLPFSPQVSLPSNPPSSPPSSPQVGLPSSPPSNPPIAHPSSPNPEVNVPPTVLSGSGASNSPVSASPSPVVQPRADLLNQDQLADPWKANQFGTFPNQLSNPLPNHPLGQPLPPELDRWNWGATLLPGLWSINNRVWIGLIAWSCLLTCGISWVVIAILLGARGNQWAWRSRQWQSVEAFKANQRAWSTAGIVVWGIYAALLTLLVAIGSLTPDSPEQAASNSSDSSTLAGSAAQQQSASETNIFGSTEALSAPTDSIDGTWQLNWALDGSTHEGTLTVKGNQGQLRVAATGNGQTDRIQETMRLWSSSRGLILLGYNPIDLSTKAASTSYSPDNFLFEPQSDGTYKVTVCDDGHNCADVSVTSPGT